MEKILGQSIRMVGQFLHMRQGEQEQMASRVTFELEEQTASAVREEQLRGEYAQAADALRTELSEEAAHNASSTSSSSKIFLHRLDLGQSSQHWVANTQVRSRTCSSSTLTQVQGLHNELQTAQRQFSDQLSQERAAKGQEIRRP